MPAPIEEFVEVNVTTTGAAADKFGFGNLLGVFDHSATANRQDGPFSSVQELNDAGFTVGAEPAVNAWGTAVFAQDDGVSSCIVGREDAGDASLTVTLDAIEAAGSESWYSTNIESRVNADILLAAAWMEARAKILIVQTDEAALLAGTPGNIGELLKAQTYNRTSLIYHATDAEYLDGAWGSSFGGLNLDAIDGVGIAAFRQLEGVPFDPVTGPQALAIYTEDANLFGRNKGLNFTSKGTMASGRFMDVTTTIDWTKARLEEAILALFVGTPTKIAYTNGGINRIRQVVSGVLDQGVSFGHYSPDFPRLIIAPDISEVSTADKINRVLTIQVIVTIAGAIQKLIMNVNLQF